MGFMKSLLLLTILIAIPIFGVGVSFWVLGDINQAIAEWGIESTVAELCTPTVLAEAPGLSELCNEVAPILLMQKASLVSGVVTVVLLLSFVLAAAFAGTNRQRITTVFPALVFVSLFVLSGLVLVQGAILTYGAYLAESYAIGRVHFILIGGIGLGALVTAFRLIGSSFKMARKQTHSVMGLLLDKAEHPKLFSFVNNVAEKLSARCPDHIVAGLEPNFYVTSADVSVIGANQVLKGEMLFLSLPLSRILTTE